MFPDFFATAPTITMHDPLTEFLGGNTTGLLEYRYADAVRLAGHSCPTVASAFLFTRLALKQLYAEDLPVRGEITVEFAETEDAGVTGVMAAITTLITGATASSGFKGLAGKFNRRNKLHFGRRLKHGSVRFTRMDTGKSAEISIDLSPVPSDPRVGELLPLSLQGKASEAQEALFKALWQERVKRLLTEHADDPAVFTTYDVEDIDE